MFKKLDTLKDIYTGVTYDLYVGNLKDLGNRLKNQLGMTDSELQKFNSSIRLTVEGAYNESYVERIIKLKAREDGFGRHHRDLESDKEILLRMEDKLNTDGWVSELDEVNNHLKGMGYETMPVAISVKDKNLSDEVNNIELLDGFNRMFYVSDLPDRDILIKVYDQLTDSQWIKAMTVFNSWKYAQDSNLSFFDRGFKLGLYQRYGIDTSDLYNHKGMSINNLLSVYIGREVYSTLFGNTEFSRDLVWMHEISTFVPVFRYVTKRKNIELDYTKDKNKLPQFFEMINKLFVRELGKRRRKELKENIINKKVELSIYIDFLKREHLQEHFIKLGTMSVPGHVENYINKHLSEEIIETVKFF